MWIKVAEIGQGPNVSMGRRQLDWLEIAGYASIVLAALAAAIIIFASEASPTVLNAYRQQPGGLGVNPASQSSDTM
jgi:hypothetical protein